ncbi:MAG: hypothetical protein VYD64_08445 [Pseudomonadota bacterium]|nr:hypothetical protein [Pseudomonadota bacterium]
MNRHPHCVRHSQPFVLVVILAVALSTGAARAANLDNETTYVGCLEASGSNLPIVTQLRPTDRGISGSYVFIERDGRPVKGRIEELGSGENGQVRLSWHDRHGAGELSIRISEDQSSFTGQWRSGSEGKTSNWWGREGVYSMLGSQSCVLGDAA